MLTAFGDGNITRTSFSSMFAGSGHGGWVIDVSADSVAGSELWRASDMHWRVAGCGVGLGCGGDWGVIAAGIV